MSEQIMTWRLSSDSRDDRTEYIGPDDFYFTVKQLKRGQKPVGTPSMEFTSLGGRYLEPEREADLVRALHEALAVAREWTAPRPTTQAQAEVSDE